MNSRNSLSFRIELAQGFLAEAAQDFALKRWRSCVDNSQLAVENSAKAILMIYGVTSRSHDPAKVLSKLLYAGHITGEAAELLKSVLSDMVALGADEHFLTDYGDETTMTLPWELYDERSAETALAAAKKVTGLSQEFAARTRGTSQTASDQESAAL